MFPNGVYPAGDGMLYMVGLPPTPGVQAGIHVLGVSGQVKPLSGKFGRLDGIYKLSDGSLLITDWSTGSLSRWTENGEMRKLADGFKGPADFCVMPQQGGLTVIVPDLVQSQLRFVQLRK